MFYKYSILVRIFYGIVLCFGYIINPIHQIRNAKAGHFENLKYSVVAFTQCELLFL